MKKLKFCLEIKHNFKMDPWNHIFTTLNYKGDKDFIITADQIKECGKSWKGKANQFEPRLLCYQTSADTRPTVFQNNNLCILPIKNGTYMILKKNIYMKLDYSPVTPIELKRDQSSVILQIGGSETSLIDNLRYSGVFERPEILNEPITHGPMLNGRHRISMDMKCGEQDIQISGVQYETDSCFESSNKILIIEGKSSSKPIDSFNIRQLYFPYREAQRLAQGKKEIVCLFIHELSGLIHIWKYTFDNVYQMDSIRIVGHYIYTFRPT
jgi:hypothetical protein